MILPDGTIVDTFYDYGAGQRVPDVVGRALPRARLQPRHARAARQAPDRRRPARSYAAISTNGGETLVARAEVVNNAGGYADGVRCCLFAADIDPVTSGCTSPARAVSATPTRST